MLFCFVLSSCLKYIDSYGILLVKFIESFIQTIRSNGSLRRCVVESLTHLIYSKIQIHSVTKHCCVLLSDVQQLCCGLVGTIFVCEIELKHTKLCPNVSLKQGPHMNMNAVCILIGYMMKQRHVFCRVSDIQYSIFKWETVLLCSCIRLRKLHSQQRTAQMQVSRQPLNKCINLVICFCVVGTAD